MKSVAYSIIFLLGLTHGKPIARDLLSAVYIASASDGLCLSTGPFAGQQLIGGDCGVATTAIAWRLQDHGAGTIVMDVWPTDGLDYGTAQEGGEVKILPLVDNSPTQSWVWTKDNRITTKDGKMCLTEGTSGAHIQMSACVAGSIPQEWVIGTSAQIKNAKHDVQIPFGTTYMNDPAGAGVRIHPDGRFDFCVMVQNNNAKAGERVAVSYCVADDDQYKNMQFWDITAANTTDHKGGHVTLKSDATLCLDAGTNIVNGAWVTIETCSDTAKGQMWYFGQSKLNFLSIATGKPFADGVDMCLNAEELGTNNGGIPYAALEPLQMWTCWLNMAQPNVDGDRQSYMYVNPPGHVWTNN